MISKGRVIVLTLKETAMGLDAKVYIRRDKLPFEVDARKARVDDQTGEVYFDDPTDAPRSPEAFVAVHKRLGNAAAISFLAEEIKKALDEDALSFLTNKVLYSATHAGDVINLDQLNRLREEIAAIRERTKGQRSAELEKLLTDFEELIRAAEEQGNPITFV
jgi:hypothetical protein